MYKFIIKTLVINIFFSKNIKGFTVTFGQFNAFFLNKSNIKIFEILLTSNVSTVP